MGWHWQNGYFQISDKTAKIYFVLLPKCIPWSNSTTPNGQILTYCSFKLLRTCLKPLYRISKNSSKHVHKYVFRYDNSKMSNSKIMHFLSMLWEEKYEIIRTLKNEFCWQMSQICLQYYLRIWRIEVPIILVTNVPIVSANLSPLNIAILVSFHFRDNDPNQSAILPS